MQLLERLSQLLLWVTPLTLLLGAITLVLLVLLILQLRQKALYSQQISRLSNLLEQAINHSSHLPLETISLDRDLNELMRPINRLLEARAHEGKDHHHTLKQMARGLNHNMNNLLFGILGAAQLIQRRTKDAEILNWASVVHSDGQQLTEVIKELTEAVTEQIDQTPETIAINQSISTLLTTQQLLWQQTAETQGCPLEFHTTLCSDASYIRANGSGLNKLLKHLLQNAVDATAGGGNIWIRTFHQNPEEITIEIRDDGIGMDATTRRRVFDPFFTTKHKLGTGLGLSTVLTTVLQWDGTVSVRSEPGHGATFTVTFPVAESPVQSAPITESNLRSARVLVVDDQEAIGSVITSALHERFSITVFQDAESLLKVFVPGQWDIAMIDLGLPGLPGNRLAELLRQQDPDIIR
ncbi:MAG: hybrid sensor histidine kinase/response regulator, partial [Immundisolibacteraceae bacterium]|nr:hybrid sensor histidine kinase/response regulator [Immundisolibacteraceae bacterium]